MARLALTTIGVLHERPDHARIKGFVDRVPDVFAAAEGSEGFIGRSVMDPETGEHDWGGYVCPSFLSAEPRDQIAQTLSLWRDMESVMAFVYTARHGEALRRRRDWFREGDYPVLAAWWVADDHEPTWAEAGERLEKLHTGGPSAEAFTFKSAFDADGNPCRADQSRVQEKMARNAAKA
ncbi:MAG: DUF3291 domain-containing protein [Alphaproteobacteria bacterium]